MASGARPKIAPKPRGLMAGVARRDISPRQPMVLVGYPHVERTSVGVHDPLYAAALYLEDGGRAVILIAVDILLIPASMAKSCREAIARATGVPVRNILLSATHTHSGPGTVGSLTGEEGRGVPKVNQEYLEAFGQGILGAAVDAKARAEPARVAIARAEVEGVGGNRLSPDGAMDREAGILYAKRARDGLTLALALVYGMHPTVMHEDSRWVSADFPYYTRLEIENHLPGATLLYHNGPCGNLSPRHHVRGQTFEEAERLGRRLGRTVVAAVKGLKEGDFQDSLALDGAQEFVDLPPRSFPTVSEAGAGLRKAVEQFNRLKAGGAPHGPVRTAECVVFGAEETLALARAGESGGVERWLKQYLPAEVQVLRVGDGFLPAFSCELFVEYGLEVKQRAPAKTFPISLANGELHGYIVTPEAEAAGGYEAAYSLFKAKAGRILVETALLLIRRLS